MRSWGLASRMRAGLGLGSLAAPSSPGGEATTITVQMALNLVRGAFLRTPVPPVSPHSKTAPLSRN